MKALKALKDFRLMLCELLEPVILFVFFFPPEEIADVAV